MLCCLMRQSGHPDGVGLSPAGIEKLAHLLMTQL